MSRYVDVYAIADRTLEVRYRGQKLGYRLFDRDQRVTQSQIVEHKFLGEALNYIKQKQEDLAPPARRRIGQQRKQYKRKTADELSRPEQGTWGQTHRIDDGYDESEHLE